MPRILSYTPPWLSHPSPGYDLFTAAAGTSAAAEGASGQQIVQNSVQDTYRGPHRVVASRGAEVFVAVGNTIRWADLSMLKDEWEEKKAQRKKGSRGARERSETPYEDPLEGVGYKVSHTTSARERA